MTFEDRCIEVVASVTDTRAYFFQDTLMLETQDPRFAAAVYAALSANNQNKKVIYGKFAEDRTFYNFFDKFEDKPMSAIDTGGPAFPVSTRPMEKGLEFGHQDGPNTWQYGGMTLRDHFAAKVLQGVMVNATGLDQLPDDTLFDVATQCYRMADAMLKARAK